MLALLLLLLGTSPDPLRPAELAALSADADAAFADGRFADARAGYERLLERSDGRGYAMLRQIARCLSREGRPAEALSRLDQVVAADPDNAELRLIVAEEALRGGQRERAAELLGQVDFARVGSPLVYRDIGVLYLQIDAPDEAVAWLDRAILGDPRFVDAIFQRALAHLQARRVAPARADLLRVAELAPDSPQGRLSRSVVDLLRP